MTYFSEKPYDCKVEVWRPRGDGFKWEETLTVSFQGLFHGGSATEAFAKALERSIDEIEPGRNRYSGCLAICDDPYHKHAHPVSVRIPDRWPNRKKPS